MEGNAVFGLPSRLFSKDDRKSPGFQYLVPINSAFTFVLTGHTSNSRTVQAYCEEGSIHATS